MRRFAVLALAMVGIACGAQPIGRVAVPGTTIAIPVPPSYFGGFGLRIGTDPATAPAFDANHPFEDPQRGEMLFKLVELGTQEVYGYLPRRWITRVGLDESTPEALDGAQQGVQGQVLALVDIPVDVEDGDYEIRVERYRRDSNSPTLAFTQIPTTIKDTIPFGGQVTLPWNGWATDDPSDGIPIKIQGPAANPPLFMERKGWQDLFYQEYSQNLGTFTDAELRKYMPHPSFTVFTYEGSNFPAAVEMEFDYPIERMRIRGVKLFRDAPSSAMVSWTAEDPNATVNCGASPGRLKIQMMDPGRQAAGVEVMYELRNFSAPCGHRIVPTTDVALVGSTYHAYDENGVQLSGYTPVIFDNDR